MPFPSSRFASLKRGLSTNAQQNLRAGLAVLALAIPLAAQVDSRAPGSRGDVGTPPIEGSAGCVPAWLPTGGGQPGVHGTVHDIAEFDDGSGGGAALYSGGAFSAAGGVIVNHIAKWDGESWSRLGSGMSSVVNTLQVFDDGLGAGAELYAGGVFTTAGGVPVNHIAKWNGTSWAPLGSGVELAGGVRALEVFDDGSGPALYAAGIFPSAGGSPANNIAKWDGTSWSPLGGGLNDRVDDLRVHDDGSGPALYAAGGFTLAGGVSASGVARWDGTSWSPLGSGVLGNFFALESFDDGSGPALFAGGQFNTVGGVPASNMAKWDGTSWSAVGAITGAWVQCLAVHDDGAGGGPDLYAGGYFQTADGMSAENVARWNGAAWSPVGGGVGAPVNAFAVHDVGEGAGPEFFAGGAFQYAGSDAVDGIARWGGAQWSSLGGGFDSSVYSLAEFDDGAGSVLYVGGFFQTTGTVNANRVARWDGTTWSPLGAGLDDSVRALAVFDDGTGAALYAGGKFTTSGGAPVGNVAKWDGSSWSAVGSLPPTEVYALAVFDDGTGAKLYAGGGTFSAVVYRWDGTSWTLLGGPLAGGSGVNPVYALIAYDDGSGEALHAGGDFQWYGATPVNHVAKWDGATWLPVGAGTGSTVRALGVYDDGLGGGAVLCAGGEFTTAGGAPANRVARWDGASWSALGGGMNNQIRALEVFDDGGGAGAALYAGGFFTVADGQTALCTAKWDGASWSPMGGGMDNTVHVLSGFDDGSGFPALFAGGDFSATIDSGDSFLAHWACIAVDPPSIYCTGKTNSAGCVPFLSYSGVPSASSTAPFPITANDVVPSESGFLIYGSKKANLNFHGGKLCVKAPLVRTPAKTPKNAGGGCSGWILRRNFNATIQNGGDPALSAGATVFTQWRQRDPADPSGFGDSLTDALRFSIGP